MLHLYLHDISVNFIFSMTVDIFLKFHFKKFTLNLLLFLGSLSPRGDTLIFSYIRRPGSFFRVQNFEFQYFWVFLAKLIFFCGMKILWGFFLEVITKLDYI